MEMISDVTFQTFRSFLVLWGHFWQNLAQNSKCYWHKSAIWNHIHQISASLAIFLSGHMASLRQFWDWGKKWPKAAESGQKWPKKALKNQEWPECLKSDILNHLHWISACLAIVLSGHMTSLRQFWVWGQNLLKVTKNGQKRPQMTVIRLNVWIMTSKTIFIGFLLLLQSFWVVTWPV